MKQKTNNSDGHQRQMIREKRKGGTNEPYWKRKEDVMRIDII